MGGGTAVRCWCTTLSTVGPVSFEQSALDAVRQFLFQPPTENGQPTSMWVRFLIKFRISE
jgi:TonB family protein